MTNESFFENHLQCKHKWIAEIKIQVQLYKNTLKSAIHNNLSHESPDPFDTDGIDPFNTSAV